MEVHPDPVSKRWWLSIAAVGSVGLVVGASTLFGWMVDETRFDRPDEGFERLTTQVAGVPGVTVDASERWVEAPAFFDPSSQIQLTLDEASLPALLDVACSTRYADALSWSLRVRTEGGNVVSVHSTPDAPHGERCPDFGFDALGLIGHVDSAVRGLDLQAAVWEDGRFALATVDDASSAGLSALLPLVAHAEDLRAAAGLDPRRSVEINAPRLALVVEPGEQERYSDLLTDLVEEHGVSIYWATGGGQTDEAVQMAAPDREHAGIQDAVRDSGLHVADLPVRFIPDHP